MGAVLLHGRVTIVTCTVHFRKLEKAILDFTRNQMINI